MAPRKKSKGAYKRVSGLNEIFPDKDVASPKSNKHLKKKTSNTLGLQWSNEELEHFYEAYRKHGKDWRKVAASLPTRSAGMVEALYKMNRAYLSLPEGMSSVVGLKAMMTDHYNVLEGSASDQDATETRKLQKRKWMKVQDTTSQDLVHSDGDFSIDSCLSLLKRKRTDGSQSRAVGKRTPRCPISSLYKRDERDAKHIDGSPQVSQSHSGKPERMKPSLRQSWERMATVHASASLDELLEGSTGSRGTEMYARDARSLMDIKGVGNVEARKKGKKSYQKRGKIKDKKVKEFEDGGEAYSRTEERDNMERNLSQTSNVQLQQHALQGPKRRTKKVFFGDETVALDALQMLVDLSLMMSESSVQLKEEKPPPGKEDSRAVPEATSVNYQGGTVPGPEEKTLYRISGSEAKKRKAAHGFNVDAAPHVNESPKTSNKIFKRKSKPMVPKATGEEGNKSVVRGKPSDASRQLKLDKPPESSDGGGNKGGETGSAISTTQPVVSQVNSPNKHRSRQKRTPSRTWGSSDSGASHNTTSIQDMALRLKGKLSCWLSSDLARRWCTFEWFYSGIDYLWFSKREFVEYMKHVGLGDIPKLTRTEWSFIRSSLGKPRRFSGNFLCEERKKLEHYRESVRKHYTDLRTGAREGLHADLARPLSVGQRVTAIHPKTRQLHDGRIMTTDHNRCMIQFDCPDAGVEFVEDINCMPLSPLDYVPEAHRRQNVGFRGPLILNSSVNPAVNTLIKQEKDVEQPNTQARGAVVGVIGAQQLLYSRTCKRETEVQAIPDLACALDNQASSALVREHNVYPLNPKPPWLKPPNAVDKSPFSQESEHNVLEVVNGSRSRARAMVDTAVKAILSLKEGEDAFTRIGEAIDSVHIMQRNDGAASEEPNHNNHASDDAKPSTAISSNAEAQIPSELIASCVGTLLMIQSCTERQYYPPADVVQVLDSAVSSLKPCCPENLHVYQEIQTSMGRLRTQILALIPT